MNVYLFRLFQICDLSLHFLPFTLDSLHIFLYFTLIAFTSCFVLQLYSIISVSILITSVLNSASGTLAISLSLISFSGVLICSFFHSGHMSLSWRTCYVVKGGALDIHQGRATYFTAVVVLYVGERSEREQCCLLVCRPAFSHFPHFPQTDCVLSGADSKVGGLVYILGPCGCL